MKDRSCKVSSPGSLPLVGQSWRRFCMVSSLGALQVRLQSYTLVTCYLSGYQCVWLEPLVVFLPSLSLLSLTLFPGIMFQISNLYSNSWLSTLGVSQTKTSVFAPRKWDYAQHNSASLLIQSTLAISRECQYPYQCINLISIICPKLLF